MGNSIRKFTYGDMVEYWDEIHELWKKGYVNNIDNDSEFHYEISPSDSSSIDSVWLYDDEVRQIPPCFLKGETVYIPGLKFMENSYDNNVSEATVIEFLSTRDLYLVKINSCDEMIWMEKRWLFSEKDDAVCNAELLNKEFGSDVKNDE